MKLRFNREEMGEALSAICGVAAARTTKELLRCVRIEAGRDVVVLSASDLELSLRYAVTQVEVEEPGETLVVAETLARIVRECADDLLSAEVVEDILHVRGTGSHFQIVVHDPAGFPAVPAGEGKPDISIEYAILRRLVEWTVFASARESTRYAINGVLWDVEGGRLTMAATDGRRLSLARGDLIAEGATETRQAIVPGKALTLLTRLPIEDDVRVGVKLTRNQLQVDMGRAMISTCLVEGHFPKYQDVIPKDCDRVVDLDTAELLSALKRAALLTNEESKGVRFSFAEGSLTLSSRAPEQGEAEVALPVEYHGEPMDIGFNPQFLLDVLRVVHTDRVMFAFRASARPGVVRVGDDFVYVVMPVSLSPGKTG